MATMFPSHVESFTTAGEGTVYHFLRRMAQPDEQFLVWYSPDIDDREPDFILLSPDSGLIVFEVKDWAAHQLVSVDPKTVVLKIGNREERRKQPLAQAKEYVHALMNFLGKRTKEMRNGKPNIPCPIACGAIFTNITRKEFHDSGLANVMDGAHVLCKDDITEPSPMVYDVTGRTLKQWLYEHFPPLFEFSLNDEKINWLRACIFPVARVDLPKRAGTATQAETVLALDREQENIARFFGPGKTLLLAPAGSGKSLVLAHQAWNWPRVNKNIKRILFTCFNLSLVGYVRRLLSRKGASLGPEGVEVIPFYDLCQRILGKTLSHTDEGPDYYVRIVKETLECLEGEHPLKGHWDAMIVDEGQDFSEDMARVLLALAPKSGTMTVAQDCNQSIYANAMESWEKLGIPDLKIRRLVRQYRNTRSIAQLAAKVLEQPVQPEQFAGADGLAPALIEAADWPTIIGKVAGEVAALVRKGVAMSEIAILYVKASVPTIDSLPETLLSALETKGVLGQWASQDERSKRTYDITTDSVTISTVYSVKGLDFAHVFLLGLDILESGSEHDRRLAYVGMTRARESLTLVQCTSGH